MTGSATKQSTPSRGTGLLRHFMPRNDEAGYDPPNALKVMMVRVSCTPSMVCTFWAMK
jgi:hypothetical protein